MSDLPPPSGPQGPGSFEPPGGQPPPPPGWAAGAPGAFPGSSPIPLAPAPSGGEKNRLPIIVLALVVLAGAGVGTYLLTKSDGKKTTTEVSLPLATRPSVTVPEVTIPAVTVPDVTAAETIPRVTLPHGTFPPSSIPPETAPEPTAATTPGGQAAAELSIAEQWYYLEDPDSTNYDWGVIVDNSGSASYQFVEVQADFFDADGRLLGTESQYVSTAIPGKNIATGYLDSAVAPPTRMEAKVVVDEFMTDTVPAPAGTLNFDQLAVADATDFSFDVTGQITSTFATDVQNIAVYGLWRDAGGAVIFTANDYVDHVPPGTPTVFSITVFSNTVPRIPPSEVYFTIG